MRLGAYIMQPYKNAEEYTAMLRAKGYRAAYCPEYLVGTHQHTEIAELKQCLRENDIVLAEVGAWVNPMAPDKKQRETAQAYLIDRLALADELGACCCVNVVGSFSDVFWYAPCAENFSEAYFEIAIEVYRRIIDAVDVKNTRMTFELMPYNNLDTAKAYFQFLDIMDRPNQTAVHLDLANMIHDPRSFFRNREIFHEAVELLGKQVVSVHMKDLVLDFTALNTQISECIPGRGGLDMGYALELLNTLPVDLPVMLEHLSEDAAYDEASGNLRAIAKARGICL